MASGGEIQGSENTPPWMEQKRSSFHSLTGTENTDWDTAVVHMSVDEEVIIKATGSFNNPVEYWGCNNSPRYHTDTFHTYINCPNKSSLEVSEQAKQSIQEYAQRTSVMEGNRYDQDS